MSILTRAFAWLYTFSLKLYPADFQLEFSDEMRWVLSSAIEKTKKIGTLKLIIFFSREIRDLPGSIWQEHLRSRKGVNMNQNNLTWRPVNTKELLVGLALFVVPILGDLVKLVFGYSIGNGVGNVLLIATLAFVVVVLVFGIIKGFPRWTVPYLGVSLIPIVMLQAVFPLWGLFVNDVYRITKFYTKTLTARIEYSALLNGFFWLVPFVTLILFILLLRVWPRTRKLAQQINQDWTLLSFTIYSGVVFALELVFEEYAYDEAWKVACRVCLALGAWIYFKNADHRKRILALLVGVTMAFWIAAVGKWIILPLQSWGAWYGYDHWTYRRFELGSTLATWGWVIFFMLIPSLLTLIPRSRQTDPAPEETLTPA